MKTRPLGNTGLSIAPIVFGGNVFGWTIDEKTSFDVLDAFVDLGFNAIDTADVYSAWAPCNSGGESETIIGNWLRARPGMRDRVVIFTKVGFDSGVPGEGGLSRRWIEQAVEGSRRRLGIDSIDLYFSHRPDPTVALEETLATYDDLIKAGAVKAIGLSGATAGELEDALNVARTDGLPRYQVLQPEYNLYDRGSYDGALRDLCMKEELGVVTYYSLASGFLTGKYRSEDDLGKSVRGQKMTQYFNYRGFAVLDALQAVADRHGTEAAQIALAWLIAKEGVTAPIASATTVTQVQSFAQAAGLSLSREDMELLEGAGS